MLAKGFDEIDRSIAIVVEAAQNLNCVIFPLKSKAKNFDGLVVGFRPSEEIFCAYKSVHYDALRGSSGNDFRPSGGNRNYAIVRYNSLRNNKNSLSAYRYLSVGGDR